ncbi:serine/threonine-protein phosphatase [Streptomyces sp. NBC_01007]|nr:serine/threonine-protein phosphatase [Streptomyces sp. NBC_01007]
MGEQLVGATCLYAVYGPVSRRRSVARVGNPPPVVTAPDARGWLRRLPAGPPLSLGGLPFEAREDRQTATSSGLQIPVLSAQSSLRRPHQHG